MQVRYILYNHQLKHVLIKIALVIQLQQFSYFYISTLQIYSNNHIIFVYIAVFTENCYFLNKNCLFLQLQHLIVINT